MELAPGVLPSTNLEDLPTGSRIGSIEFRSEPHAEVLRLKIANEHERMLLSVGDFESLAFEVHKPWTVTSW